MVKETIFKFYIGQNNKTKKAEIQKAIRIFNFEEVKGFSVIPKVKGYWEGVAENSFIVEVVNSLKNPFSIQKAKRIKGILEFKLKQFLVLVTEEKINILN